MTITAKCLLLFSVTVFALGQRSDYDLQNSSAPPNPQHLSKLAEQMCSQLPNVALLPFKDTKLSGDDVHDTLVMLGAHAVPCLVDRIVDETWLPDPSQAPIAPDVRAGDIAFFILNELGVEFTLVLPLLDKEKWEGVGIYAYFEWANQPGNRKRLQQAVRDWLQLHPKCCGSNVPRGGNSLSRPEFRLSLPEFSRMRNELARLKPGEDATPTLKALGSPSLTIYEESPHGNDWGMAKRGEHSAAVYFVERWSNSPKGRDFLRDRYVILYFTKEGKFVRMFSNVEEIPPVFPTDKDFWFRLVWPELEQ